MQEKVYKQRIKNVDELRSQILTAWDQLDQRIIDSAIREWRIHLQACVVSEGEHFEHKLSSQIVEHTVHMYLYLFIYLLSYYYNNFLI